MPHVTKTNAVVYQGAERRFLTEWYAYRSVARAKLFAEHPCDYFDCGGEHCDLHGDLELDKRIDTLARKLRKEDRDEEASVK